MSDNKQAARRIAGFLRVLARRIEENPSLAKDIDLALGDVARGNRKKKTKETPIDLDIFNIFSTRGEEGLRRKLEPLELSALKKIVAQHAFDSSRLAAKWRRKDRVINLIVERVAARMNRGKAFGEYP